MTNFEDIKLKRLTYTSGQNELEGLLFIPEGDGIFPLVVYVHGHNYGGAWQNVLQAYIFTKFGYAAFFPSMKGYGYRPTTKPDFCGPETVEGIIDGIKVIKEETYIDKNKCGIWGISRGATVASQIIVNEPDLLQAAVLQSGAYDMVKDFNWDKKIPGIKENMVSEVGENEKDWMVRSSILNMEKVKTPILILHGEQDENVSVEQAKLLDQKLNQLNKEHETVIFEGQGHHLGPLVNKNHTFPFLRRYLKSANEPAVN